MRECKQGGGDGDDYLTVSGVRYDHVHHVSLKKSFPLSQKGETVAVGFRKKLGQKKKAKAFTAGCLRGKAKGTLERSAKKKTGSRGEEKTDLQKKERKTVVKYIDQQISLISLN